MKREGRKAPPVCKVRACRPLGRALGLCGDVHGHVRPLQSATPVGWWSCGRDKKLLELARQTPVKRAPLMCNKSLLC